MALSSESELGRDLERLAIQQFGDLIGYVGDVHMTSIFQGDAILLLHHQHQFSL